MLPKIIVGDGNKLNSECTEGIIHFYMHHYPEVLFMGLLMSWMTPFSFSSTHCKYTRVAISISHWDKASELFLFRFPSNNLELDPAPEASQSVKYQCYYNIITKGTLVTLDRSQLNIHVHVILPVYILS